MSTLDLLIVPQEGQHKILRVLAEYTIPDLPQWSFERFITDHLLIMIFLTAVALGFLMAFGTTVAGRYGGFSFIDLFLQRRR